MGRITVRGWCLGLVHEVIVVSKGRAAWGRRREESCSRWMRVVVVVSRVSVELGADGEASEIRQGVGIRGHDLSYSSSQKKQAGERRGR